MRMVYNDNRVYQTSYPMISLMKTIQRESIFSKLLCQVKILEDMQTYDILNV